jgi:hypothetical protein
MSPTDRSIPRYKFRPASPSGPVTTRKPNRPKTTSGSRRSYRKVYDRLGNLRQKGEDEYKRCFTQNAQKQASFAEATRQAEKLLSAALNTH